MFCLGAVAFLIFACTPDNDLSVSAQAEPPLVEQVPLETLRLQHIRKLYQRYPAIRFPFEYHVQSSQSVTGLSANPGADTLVFGEDVPCGIIGRLSDTSLFFGFFYLIAADDAIPALVTFDKQGNRITRYVFGQSCWQGCESDCRTIVSINEQLEVKIRYEEYLFNWPSEDSPCPETPESASGYVDYLQINSLGRVEEKERRVLSSDSLKMYPITHPEE